MDEMLVQIGKRIYERRKQLRMTQDELSERAEVTPQTISSAERGQKSLRSENLFRVSKALGVSSDYLLTGNITGDDLQYLSDKLSGLTPTQYRRLEDMIDIYLAAISEQQA
ncbi:MAG: helix-turn-helix domain-containing protein [Muribaculaceae bacterium]|nr:helix-turn-helix domain-containing protein [Muribaculaceae bacterium]